MDFLLELGKHNEIIAGGGDSPILFVGYNFKDHNFFGLDLYKVKFKNCTFERCSFVNSVLSCALFMGCTLLECDFSGVDMDKAKFERCRLVSINFNGAKLNEAMFSSNHLLQAIVFKSAELEQADFYNNEMLNIDFSDIKSSYIHHLNLFLWSGCGEEPHKLVYWIQKDIAYFKGKQFSLDELFKQVNNRKFSLGELESEVLKNILNALRLFRGKTNAELVG